MCAFHDHIAFWFACLNRVSEADCVLKRVTGFWSHRGQYSCKSKECCAALGHHHSDQTFEKHTGEEACAHCGTEYI
jgi:hypothetical protein